MRKRDGACPEHGDNCPYYTPDRTAGTTKPIPLIKTVLSIPEPTTLTSQNSTATIQNRQETP